MNGGLVADISTRFLEVEQRVRDLVTDNQRLRARIEELERELAGVQGDLQAFRTYQGRREQIRERLERILKELETLKSGEPQNEEEAAGQG